VNVIRAQPLGIEVRVYFETEGEELKLEQYPNVDLVGLNIKLNLEFSNSDGAVDLVGWMDEVDAAVNNAHVSLAPNLVTVQVNFRGKVFDGAAPGLNAAKQALRKKLLKEFINTDAVVNAGGVLPDGWVSRKIEERVDEKIAEALKGDPEKPEENVRNALKEVVTPWLVGGKFQVLSLASDDQSLIIDYLLPLGQLEPFPENPQPPLDPGRLANIDHIVVLMMENRSFDNMLGYLSKHGGRAEIDGLRGGEKNPYKGLDYASLPLPGTVFVRSPCHQHECVLNQVNGGKMDGFVTDFAPRAEAANIGPGEVMGYYNAAQVPVYDVLAREFLICQRWFAAHPGPTFPNRFYTLTGRLNRDANGRWEFNNPEGSNFLPVKTKTIFDHLTAQHVSWRFYEHGYCSLRLFERYTYDNVNIVEAGQDAANFVASAQAGTLPSVTFIDPDFIDVPPGNDDQPPADIAAGQRLIGRVVKALVEGPHWNKTLLVITYDEHGGFFDHVPPPAAPAVSGVDRYGVRLPAFVVSPWVARQQVTDVVFDHTSIIKTIIRRFLSAHPPDFGERVAAANDLSQVLQPTARQDRPSIPVPPAPAPNPALARQAELATDGDGDFKELLRSMRSRQFAYK
jgi:phospholipase C